MNINYIFQNERAGSADGKITFDFGGKALSPEAEITLLWGIEENGETVALPDYTPVAKLNAETAKDELVIDKQLCIPVGVTALVARLCDGEQTEKAIFNIPPKKQAKDRGKPLYTVGFASDFHIGGWGSDAYPKEGLIKAREEFNKLVDFLVTEGDLIQWHGCFSGAEFKKYNFDGKNWGDNGERSPEFVGIGTSQWQMLEDYLKDFTIPVYHCQGNHDIIDEDHWSPMCGNEDYFGKFLTKWIKQSEESGKYETRIVRDESVHYYETTVKGHKFVFTEAPRPFSPHDQVGKEQLEWLDKVLFDGEESGKPIFVMGHSPIEPTLNKKTAYAKFTDLEDFRAILDKHPTVIYVSGHSHFTLDTLVKNAVDKHQEKASHLHNGGMTTTVNPPPMKQYNITHGTVAEVYEDGILIRGRNHTEAKWISLGLCEFIFKKPCLSGNVSIERNGSTFSAKAENTDGVEFEWYLDGKKAASGAIFECDATCGYVALRATDKNGGFKSVIYDL